MPSLAVPLWRWARERCFLELGPLQWDGANAFRERVCVAASAFSNGSAGPWECLLKIRPERVLTTLIHGVIFWKWGVATDQRRHICECHGSERAHPGLAGSAAAAGARAATGHSFPGAPLCIGRSRAGLSSSESTKHHEVLHHILAGDVKVFGSLTRHCVLRGGVPGRPTPSPAAFGQQPQPGWLP